LPDAERENVVGFLKEVKRTASRLKGIYLVPREKNKATINRLGLTNSDIINTIKYLSIEDYLKGPEPDRDAGGDLWFFCKEVSGNDVYIKLKISVRNGRDTVYCISFHEPEHEINYPYREE
jgi:hypothetical protein